MKSKNMTLMVVAIGCGLVAALLTAKLSGGGAPDTVDVIIAKKELKVGTVLDEKELEEMIGTTKLPRNSVPPDIVNNANDLKNKKLNRTLKPGNFFSVGDVGADNGEKLPDGMYKYAIKIDNVKAVTGFVQPGDHVDVLLTETMNNGKTRSGLFLRDMLILAVDTQSTRQEGGQARQQVNAVALAVTPEQGLTLSSAEKRGEVKLMLRDPKNSDKSDIAAVTKIKGIDDQQAEPGVARQQVKTVSVVVTTAEVPENTQVTKENFNNFFATRNIPEEAVFSDKTVKEESSLYGKFVAKNLEPNQQVFSTWLSDERKVAEAPKVDLEILPPPHEVVQEKPLYPRKFEQIINAHRYYFLEIGPGEFRRVDGGTEVKDLPNTEGKPDMKEKKADGNNGDPAV